MPAVMASAVLCSTLIKSRQSSSTAEACVKNLQFKQFSPFFSPLGQRRDNDWKGARADEKPIVCLGPDNRHWGLKTFGHFC
jgi:hypothetical protein